jgi:hypothetical protein
MTRTRLVLLIALTGAIAVHVGAASGPWGAGALPLDAGVEHGHSSWKRTLEQRASQVAESSAGARADELRRALGVDATAGGPGAPARVLDDLASVEHAFPVRLHPSTVLECRERK